MKKFNYGFTLVELLVCFLIIGIILAASIPAIKKVSMSYPTMTYHAFENVKTIVKIMMQTNEINPVETDNNVALTNKDMLISSCYIHDRNDSGQIIDDRILWSGPILKPDISGYICGNDDYYNEDETSDDDESLESCSLYTTRPFSEHLAPDCFNRFESGVQGGDADSHTANFCERVAAMANTTGKIDCERLFGVDFITNYYNGGTFSIKEPYIKFNANNTTENPNFTATNGQRYYISQRIVNEDISEDFGFRLIAIDLNGQKGPNIASPNAENNIVKKLNQLPDIITFLILDNGDIYPLGAAADNVQIGNNGQRGSINVNYLNSKIKGTNYSEQPIQDQFSANAQCLVGNDNSETRHRVGCQFLIRYLQSQGFIDKNGINYYQGNGSVGPYRVKFCGANNSLDSYYPGYCGLSSSGTQVGIGPANGCMGSENPDTVVGNSIRYDECKVVPIKPVFRIAL